MTTEEPDTPPTATAPEADGPDTAPVVAAMSEPAGEDEADAPELTEEAESEPDAEEGEGAAPETATADADLEPAPVAEPAPPPKKRWYVIKVASNREESTKRNIERQIKVEGLEALFGQIVIPVEEVVEVKKVTDTTKSGDKTTKTKKVIKKVKKYPGYIMAEVEWDAVVQAMLRGVSGVSDFVGAKGIGKPPPPMSELDVQRMLGTGGAGGPGGADAPKKPKTEVVKLHFEKGDKVRIREGAFANFEGEVKGITEPKEAGEHPVVTVEVQVLGRGTPIDLEFWQVDKL